MPPSTASVRLLDRPAAVGIDSHPAESDTGTLTPLDQTRGELKAAPASGSHLMTVQGRKMGSFTPARRDWEGPHHRVERDIFLLIGLYALLVFVAFTSAGEFYQHLQLFARLGLLPVIGYAVWLLIVGLPHWSITHKVRSDSARQST
ncbi:MAG: hypothetical protein H0X24_00075 [Ktedonobacterales bacterium]|nr:hypothetical protein [Ktedonobacterales bacterium]